MVRRKIDLVVGADICSEPCRSLERAVEDASELKGLAERATLTSGDGWSASPSRKAGFRQEFEVAGEKYGVCWIPPGEFDMGSPESEERRFGSETLHHVKLTNGFWLLETPVTQRFYESVTKKNPSRFKGADLPVERVSYDEALEFCKELTKLLPSGLKATLPTEAQWEYACRAGTKTAYWYGNAPDASMMNYADSGIRHTSPVKKYEPNSWGLYDMHGNVLEWCLDYWRLDYYGECPSGMVVDPKGANSGSDRVRRGGAWNNYATFCRSAFRGGDSPESRINDLGFRCLLSCD